jgi:hypothetical protein
MKLSCRHLGKMEWLTMIPIWPGNSPPEYNRHSFLLLVYGDSIHEILIKSVHNGVLRYALQ